MSKQIGIKLADGTFYPVLEEGLPKRKILDLTTVQDNQTTVMVDLYRSETGTMDDAEYVDTLQISGLNPHPSGEPDLSLSVKLDENDTLSAEVIDAESGRHSGTTVRLISRTPEERSEAPDYTLNETVDTDGELPPREDDTTVIDTSAFADDVFPAEFDTAEFDTPDFDTAGDDPENAVPAAEFTETDDAELPPMPDFTESVPDDFSPEDFEIAAIPDTVFENAEPEPAETDTDMEADMGTEADADKPADGDFPAAGDDARLDADTFTVTDDPFAAEDSAADGDFPAAGDPAAEFTETDDLDLPPMPDFTESVPDEPGEYDAFPVSADAAAENADDFPTSTDADSASDEPALHEDTLPDFSKFELPDFDELHKTEEPQHTPLFTDDDFDDPAFHTDFAAADGSGGELDFSGLYTDEFPEGEREPERKKKKLTVPVIICIICAIICLGVLAGILLYVPSQISIQITRKSDAELQSHEPAAPVTSLPEQPVRIEPVPVQPEPEPAPLPEAPAAEENRIVVADTPAVIPAPPPEPAKEPEPVRYKIKWGDTLWDLADSYYNNPWLYKKIAKANGIRNPDYIISGTYIMIPPK
ncbi:LysM peptidoglycan-binding domain-containing protein [Treponema brennaborense]|uniref:Peptidoglycan-binding lysin domain protein n=1 Tax=Treponema brennaborense (strain DSM 12168 / CIP 105900 / DD5/3) TaxID=906968 RepID=F4LMC4_TREBD|nr:LysM peptidoglycan-binding domain-containing protein [Treponema brennaborense]AEE17790.1 Peptidoglycan-binding lysin domain protein [Treponema brennaborense DSM 12168]